MAARIDHTDGEIRAGVTLAGIGRQRVWDAVRQATEPVGVARLAETLGVHPNTVRLHLGRLVEAGLVVEELESDRHPGRPGYRYRAKVLAASDGPGSYRRLSLLLATAVQSGCGARAAGRTAGFAEASHLAGSDPVVAIANSLAEEGFAPRVEAIGSDRIDVVLESCPFAAAAAVDPGTICELHLGLAEGAADAIGGVEVVGLHVNHPDQARCRLTLRRL